VEDARPRGRPKRTWTHTQPYYGSVDFVWDNPGEPVPEETFTHSHSLWSSIIPWTEIVEKDCEARKLNREDAMDHIRWMNQLRDDS